MHDASKVHYLHYLFHFATEFMQVAEVTNRLRRAARIQRGRQYAHDYTDDVTSERFDMALAQTQAGLRTAEDLAVKLTTDEIRALLVQWEQEALMLMRSVWDSYADTCSQRTKRRFAIEMMKADPDPRGEARKSRASERLAIAGPKSIDKLLKGKKAQGGVYEMDPRLLADGAKLTDMLAYLVPPAPVPPRKKR